jgi:hypothetical protein
MIGTLLAHCLINDAIGGYVQQVEEQEATAIISKAAMSQLPRSNCSDVINGIFLFEVTGACGPMCFVAVEGNDCFSSATDRHSDAVAHMHCGSSFRFDSVVQQREETMTKLTC